MMLPDAPASFLPLDSAKLIPNLGLLDLSFPPCSAPHSGLHLGGFKSPLPREAVPAALANAAHPSAIPLDYLSLFRFLQKYFSLSEMIIFVYLFSVSPHSMKPVGCPSNIHFPFPPSKKKPVLLRVPSLLVMS